MCPRGASTPSQSRRGPPVIASHARQHCRRRRYYPYVTEGSADAGPAPFRFIAYAHGDGGGGILDPPAYFELLNAIASFGYVVASPRACDVGCIDDRTTLPFDPPAFGHFYMQQLDVISWAKTVPDPLFATVNFTGGVGVAGHSMGGQATLFSSSYRNASDYDIRAAVLHHAFTHQYPGPAVPFLAMTGTDDHIAPPKMTYDYYNNPDANPHTTSDPWHANATTRGWVLGMVATPVSTSVSTSIPRTSPLVNPRYSVVSD